MDKKTEEALKKAEELEKEELPTKEEIEKEDNEFKKMKGEADSLLGKE